MRNSMQQLRTGLLLAFFLVSTRFVMAQDGDPVTEAEAILQDAEAAQSAAEAALTEAQALVDLAFNLLGIFEAISVAITIVGAALGVFGFTRLLSAESNLNKAREEVEAELRDIRAKFDRDLQEREERFTQLGENLTDSVQEQRKNISDATRATALLSFGERQWRAGDQQGALDTYQRAQTLDGQNPVTQYRLGYVHMHLSQLEAAEDALKQALAIDESFDPARVALGYVYRRMGEGLPEGIQREQLLNQAEQYMLDGLETSPKLVDENNESWWGTLGGLYRRRGQIDRAIDAYERAANVTPNSSYPFGNLATLYGRQNDIDAMLRMYERVERLARAEVQAEVGNYWGYFDLLTAHLALGHIDAAEETFPAALETVPPDATYALESLVTTLRQLCTLLADAAYATDIAAFANRAEQQFHNRQQSPQQLTEDTDITDANTSPNDE